MDSPDSELYKVFNNFREGRTFDARKLQLLAILIGKGAAKDKSNFLFDAYDADANQELTTKEVTEAFEGLTDIAINNLVDLGAGKPEDGLLEESKIAPYKKKLEANRDEKVAKIVTNFAMIRGGVGGVERVAVDGWAGAWVAGWAGGWQWAGKLVGGLQGSQIFL